MNHNSVNIDNSPITNGNVLAGDGAHGIVNAQSDARPGGSPEARAILFMAAEPTDAARLRVGEELREIQEKLQLARLRDSFRLEQRQAVRPADISQAILDVRPGVVHFSGHGTSSGELCAEDLHGRLNPMPPEALAHLFGALPGKIDCVLLNACYTYLQAAAIARSVPHVIGMRMAIGDRAAIAFSVGFYQALGAGCEIERAFRLGCAQVALRGDVGEGSTPILLTS